MYESLGIVNIRTLRDTRIKNTANSRSPILSAANKPINQPTVLRRDK